MDAVVAVVQDRYDHAMDDLFEEQCWEKFDLAVNS